MRIQTLRPEFVEFVPENLQPGVLYVSIPYATASHLCACGCGQKVVTPIRPTDWSLSWNGETISLYPSIGNWSLPCQSHYWIRHGVVEWAGSWSRSRIESARKLDRSAKRRYYSSKRRSAPDRLSK